MNVKRRACRALCFLALCFLAIDFLALSCSLAEAPQPGRTVVFWQAGFPAVDTAPVSRAVLERALGEPAVVDFVDLNGLQQPDSLKDANLLVLPYGSAVPADAWSAILSFLKHGGNLLVLGGQPLHTPVRREGNGFQAQRPQDSYSLALGFKHSYAVPVPAKATFAWRSGYESGASIALQASRFFTVEGRLDGLAYLHTPDGDRVAAPVIVSDHLQGELAGSRVVALDFDASPGFWETPDATALLQRAAQYARQGPDIFSLELQFSTLRPGEMPQLSIHLKPGRPATEPQQIRLSLTHNGHTMQQLDLTVRPGDPEICPVPLAAVAEPGFYTVTAAWLQGDRTLESASNGFWVAAPDAMNHGPVFAANAASLTLDGHPFIPIGANYFTTAEDGWDFSGPRNAALWQRDFAEMKAHGVNFVRTGVWMPNYRFIEGDLGGANERFLRNLEAFTLCAQQQQIAVNFTFFAFSPKSGQMRASTDTPPNPWLDPGQLHAQQAYVRSVLERFHAVPTLSWDLINEPSVTNPTQVFKGNYPNGDSEELAAWRGWLRAHYPSLQALADAWSVTPEQLGSFDSIPLPTIADLKYERYGNPRQVRALDYNLFAQDVFRDWVRKMAAVIRATGSTQLINVGQDEGGVTDRVLNQFYASAGVSFTTNHTYWQDDSLLWDSVAAKVVGLPNITGETGYQPAWAPDGAWRYDELTGLGLTERKWALGFAAGSTGAVQWDWAREVDFGMLRSDGSSRVWENMMRGFGSFAEQAAPWIEDRIEGPMTPPIALVLPQSLQLSVLNSSALEAQQMAVRALYHSAHGSAYAVGEYQIERLGNPKLILLPSPLGLTETAWQAILTRVRAGATLLVTGPFGADAHLHPATGRQAEAGLPYQLAPLELRNQTVAWPGGTADFTFAHNKTTLLSEAQSSDGKNWHEAVVGQGRILFAGVPIELGENMEGLGRVYRYAMTSAGIAPSVQHVAATAGILICPTEYAHATLYVLTSETAREAISFQDNRSGRTFHGTLEAGRAALLLVGTDGKLLASYGWR